MPDDIVLDRHGVIGFDHHPPPFHGHLWGMGLFLAGPLAGIIIAIDDAGKFDAHGGKRLAAKPQG